MYAGYNMLGYIFIFLILKTKAPSMMPIILIIQELFFLFFKAGHNRVCICRFI